MQADRADLLFLAWRQTGDPKASSLRTGGDGRPALARIEAFDGHRPDPATSPHPPRARHPWAELMKRVFAIDVKACPWCGGPRKQLTFITQPDVIRRILACLHLDLAPPTLAPARELSADPAR